MAGNLIIVRGFPGSGKSKVAKKLAEKLKYYHFEANMYFTDSNGTFKYDKSKLADAHNWCFDQARDCIRAGYDVIVANTFTRIWELEKYLRIAGVENVTVVRCGNDQGTSKNISDVIISRMRSNYEPYDNEINAGMLDLD